MLKKINNKERQNDNVGWSAVKLRKKKSVKLVTEKRVI